MTLNELLIAIFHTILVTYYLSLGAPRQNRTAITGLQNQCTTIVLVGRIVTYAVGVPRVNDLF